MIKISEKELKDYQKFKDETLKNIQLCEKHIKGENIIKTFHFNSLQYFSKLSFVFEEFNLVMEKNNFESEKDYYFAIGELNGKVTLLLENIQIVGNSDEYLYKKVQSLKLSVNNTISYLKSIV